MKHYKLVEFLSNLNVKPPLHERKPPRLNVKPPFDDFLATILILLNWRDAGAGLLTATGKPTDIATIEMYDKTHGLCF